MNWKLGAFIVGGGIVLLGALLLFSYALLEAITLVSEAWHEGAK